MMMYLEVENVNDWTTHLVKVLGSNKYDDACITGPSDEGYALISHLWDPSGVLWHIVEAKG